MKGPHNTLDYYVPLMGSDGVPSTRPVFSLHRVLAHCGGHLFVTYLVSSYAWAALMMFNRGGLHSFELLFAPVMTPLGLLGIVIVFFMDAHYVGATARELSVEFAAFPVLFAVTYVVLYVLMRRGRR